jgi:ABC-type multidrug transport system ATPase subunit
MHPILAASSLRIDVAGVPTLDAFSVKSTGQSVLILGATHTLFEAAAGLRAIDRGELLVVGLPPLDAVRSGACASAPLDPPLPRRWTPYAYATWSARLAGQPASSAREMAAEALDRLQLAPFARTKLGSASLAVRRGTVIAAALATGAATLLIEDPVTGLAEGGRAFARVLARSLSDRRTAVFAGAIALESPLALAADEAIVVDGGRVALQGAPAELAASEGTFSLRVLGDVRAFVQLAAARGARLLAPLPPAGPAPPPALQIGIELGELRTSDLLAIASSCDAVILELRPLARAFA